MKVCWDDYSQDMEKHVPNHQPANIQKLGGSRKWVVESLWIKGINNLSTGAGYLPSTVVYKPTRLWLNSDHRRRAKLLRFLCCSGCSALVAWCQASAKNREPRGDGTQINGLLIRISYRFIWHVYTYVMNILYVYKRIYFAIQEYWTRKRGIFNGWPSVHVEFIRQGEVTFDGENHWQNSDSSRKNLEFQAKNKDSIGFYPEEIGRPAP